MKLQTALLVLALVVGTSAELAFTNSLHSKRSTEQAKPASGPAGYGYAKADVKHLCLKENKQYNCRYVGCPSVSECALVPDSSFGTGVVAECADCYNCQTHAIGQSDLVCCDKPKSYGYGYEGPEDQEHDDMMALTPSLKIGSCDWDMDIYRCETPIVVPDADNGRRRAPLPPNQGGCTESILMENGAYKVGTAWATCYLNADAEYCGHPFCDRMVLSFQGGVYVMDAYSTNSGVLASNGVTVDLDNVNGCFAFEEWIDGQLGNNGTAEAKKSGHKHVASKQGKMSALSRSIASTGLLKKLGTKYPDVAKRTAAKKRVGTASNPSATVAATAAKPQYSIDSADDKKYWEGVAVMFSGAVTVTSMDKQIDYTRGMMEYVPWFVGEETDVKPAAATLVVTPNQYDILLVNDGKGSSYDEDYPKDDYKGPEHKPEGYYKKYDTPEHKMDYYKRDGGDRDYYPRHPKGADRERYHRGERDEERRRGPSHRQ